MIYSFHYLNCTDYFYQNISGCFLVSVEIIVCQLGIWKPSIFMRLAWGNIKTLLWQRRIWRMQLGLSRRRILIRLQPIEEKLVQHRGRIFPFPNIERLVRRSLRDSISPTQRNISYFFHRPLF